MNRRSIASTLFVLALAAAAAASVACRDAPLASNVRSNTPPVANAGDAQEVSYDGSPVTVTLNGSRSRDADGTVVEYRWLSANAPADGGSGRGEPDPDDVARPKVTLEPGVWLFTLFVLDDEGGVSLPSSVTITVGDAVDPEVAECADSALQAIPEDCRVCECGLSDMCRAAIAGCDQACWDFYTCVQNECGELIGGDEAALSECVRASCAAFFGGIGGYMPLVPCINSGECAEVCAASVRM